MEALQKEELAGALLWSDVRRLPCRGRRNHAAGNSFSNGNALGKDRHVVSADRQCERVQRARSVRRRIRPRLFGRGDRDRAKRPLMGEAAGKGSDFVVLTSDNPRSEDPLAIMNDALVGLQKSGAKYTMEPDRRKAIAFALQQAAPGDIVLLAGKGHEK